MEMKLGDPQSVRKLETRVLVAEADGWTGYTYRWNDQQTDALLIAEQQTEVLTVRDQTNQVVRTQTWTYPSRFECMQCHTQQDGRVLGVRTRQINRTFSAGGVPVNQLELWNAAQVFDRDVGSASQYERYPELADATASLHDRARAYLA